MAALKIEVVGWPKVFQELFWTMMFTILKVPPNQSKLFQPQIMTKVLPWIYGSNHRLVCLTSLNFLFKNLRPISLPLKIFFHEKERRFSIFAVQKFLFLRYFAFIHLAHNEFSLTNFQKSLSLQTSLKSLIFLDHLFFWFTDHIPSNFMMFSFPNKVGTCFFQFMNSFNWNIVGMNPIHYDCDDDSVS